MPRPKPFSGALKKKQLQERRARHNSQRDEQQRNDHGRDTYQVENTSNASGRGSATDPYNGRFVSSFSKEYNHTSYGNAKPSIRENSNHPTGTRLRSVFMRRSPSDIERSRKASMQPLEFLPESELEVSFESMFPEVIGFPKRPKWDYSMSREQLEKNETQMFEEWMDSIYNRYPTEGLSYFEHNLEVWRQLWRVLEISDIIMVIVDIRHPVIHFPPSLYEYVVNDMKRKLVVVFNKVDLVAPHTLFAWKEYFQEKFPKLHFASFSCYPPDPTLINDSSTAALQRVVRRPRHRFYNAVGVKDVLVACKDVEVSKNGDQVDWDNLIAQYDADKEAEFQDSEAESDQENDKKLDQSHRNLLENENDQRLATALQTVNIEDDEHVPHKDFVTIGLVGMYPIAQVQEPYSVVQYLAMRVNVPRLLKLDPPPSYEHGPFRWSAFGICESFALQRGFITAKAGHPDVYRAANAILRLANDGRILLSFKPPGFFTSTKYEKLRVAQADEASAISTDDNQNAHRRNSKVQESSEEYSDDDEERVNTRVGGFFGLLQDDNDDNDDNDDEEDDSNSDSDNDPKNEDDR
ncbi:Guanine nucleotide-binding-like protein 1 [Modicella reniformis]|uniref:Guanine nucleotide-binding-like protein 1 n=1 Tax=Modicella reniformis TaxID=1440133 RepID=A0A9P6IMD2_9FUNG|nr:Guanine nucleotide-binding-like protein 1 [Modicella reniformis]